MNAAYDKLCEHLTNQNVGFWSRSEDLSICTDFRGEVGTYRIFARIDADDSLFQVFGHSPVRVPPGSRPAIAEAVARINCGLKVGKFEMDCDEGELRFAAPAGNGSEGFQAFDLHSARAAQLRENAVRHGCLTSEGNIALFGVTIRLV